VALPQLGITPPASSFWREMHDTTATITLILVPSPQVIQRIGQIRAGVIPVQPDDGFHLADTQNLIRTCEIEAVLAAVVITVGVVRRRQRRARRRDAAAVG
jgi:hypothetical protein